MSAFASDRASLSAADDAQERLRERRRSSLSSLAIPVCDQQDLGSSINFGNDEVEFEAQGVKINHDGLFIEGANVSEVHQDDLRVLGELGRGACSVVKQAQHDQTRQLYAIKVFSVFDRDKRAQLLKEVETLRGMECPSLISFAGGYFKEGSIHVVLEYMDRGSLTDLIHDWQDIAYGEDLMSAITIQMLWGLGYLHFEHCVHRDIKPQNVLLNSKGEVKLSDFGIARALEGDADLAQTMVGTIRYMSPERLAGAGYGMAADVWSLGVVVLEMASRRRPFDNMVSQIEFHDRLEQDRAIDDLMQLVPDRSPELEEVVRGCLQMRPEDRLSPEELLELDWFRQFRRPIRSDAVEGEGTCGGRGNCAEGARCASCDVGTSEDTPSNKAQNGQNTSAGGTEANGNGESQECGSSSEQANGEAQASTGEEAPANEDGNEQHDLDRATSIVRDYLARVVEHGMTVDDEAEISQDAHLGLSGRRGFADMGASSMIRTMCSDIDHSDSDTGGNGDDIFDGFP